MTDLIGITAKSADTGKYIRTRDRKNSENPDQWTGESIQEARIYKNIGHLKASIGTWTRHDIKLPDGFCKRCGEQRDATHKRCFECGGSLGGRIKKPRTRSIPTNVKVVRLKLVEVDEE